MIARHLAPTVVIAIIACGAPSSVTGSQPSRNAAQVWHSYAQCVRDQGAPDFPDPLVDDQGRARFRDDTARAAAQRAPESAMTACASFLDRLPASARDDAPTPQQMLRLAQCMRSHGLDDWPDPDSQGRFHLPSTLLPKQSPRWPQVEAAMSGQCKQFDPTGRIPTA